MWFFRKMQRKSYKTIIKNEEVMRREGETRTLSQSMRQGQATFFGHVMRRKGLERLVTTGKIHCYWYGYILSVGLYIVLMNITYTRALTLILKPV